MTIAEALVVLVLMNSSDVDVRGVFDEDRILEDLDQEKMVLVKSKYAFEFSSASARRPAIRVSRHRNGSRGK